MLSPGDSSVPASIEPAITQSAPAAMAFAISPLYFIPPSAIIGILFSYIAKSPSVIGILFSGVAKSPSVANSFLVGIDS